MEKDSFSPLSVLLYAFLFRLHAGPIQSGATSGDGTRVGSYQHGAHFDCYAEQHTIPNRHLGSNGDA